MGVSISTVEAFILEEYLVPSITVYNRLESTPRTLDFDRSLKAEVRDPMWMLSRQWQFGEFKGEDAATAVTTKIVGEHTTINTLHFPNEETFAYDASLPLETVVEREPLTPDLNLSVQLARYFLKLIKGNSSLSHLPARLLTEYGLNYTIHENDDEAKLLRDTVSGKIFDGYLFLKACINNTIPADITGIDQEKAEFINWFKQTYNQPPEAAGTAWTPSQLEYQFAVSASADQTTLKKLTADHYPGGHLDWYSFDINSLNATPSAHALDLVSESVQSYIPTPLTFRGMPNPRFWTMEESVTDFGKLSTTPTGLLHLLLAEFGLMYSNDWFMLPYQLMMNTFCEVKGVLVKDVFGEYTIIRPAGRGAEEQWQRWSMFTHTNTANKKASTTNSFYLVPAVQKILEAPRLEQVNFVRDEMANMVWGIENIVPSGTGKGVSGNEMALNRTNEEDEAQPTPNPDPNKPAIRYVLGTTVPSNWIPFIPVHIEESNAEIRFQRAKFPTGTNALGKILTEKRPPYYIDEHILGSAGLLVSRSFQLARFIDGAGYLWLGRRKETGKGEAWSNLKFDQIVDNL